MGPEPGAEAHDRNWFIVHLYVWVLPEGARKSPSSFFLLPQQNPSVSRGRSSKKATLSMADSMISLDKVKAFWNAQIHDDEKWAYNMKLMRAAGLFGGSIFLMRQFGDLMAV